MGKPALEVIEGRAKTHGDYSVGSNIALVMHRTLKRHGVEELDDEMQYALWMFCAKISRILSGNPRDVDHWRDIAGYASLVQKYLEEEGAPDNGK